SGAVRSRSSTATAPPGNRLVTPFSSIISAASFRGAATNLLGEELQHLRTGHRGQIGMLPPGSVVLVHKESPDPLDEVQALQEVAAHHGVRGQHLPGGDRG